MPGFWAKFFAPILWYPSGPRILGKTRNSYPPTNIMSLITAFLILIVVLLVIYFGAKKYQEGYRSCRYPCNPDGISRCPPVGERDVYMLNPFRWPGSAMDTPAELVTTEYPDAVIPTEGEPKMENGKDVKETMACARSSKKHCPCPNVCRLTANYPAPLTGATEDPNGVSPYINYFQRTNISTTAREIARRERELATYLHSVPFHIPAENKDFVNCCNVESDYTRANINSYHNTPVGSYPANIAVYDDPKDIPDMSRASIALNNPGLKRFGPAPATSVFTMPNQQKINYGVKLTDGPRAEPDHCPMV